MFLIKWPVSRSHDSSLSLTIGVIGEASVQKDAAGLLLRLLGQVDSHVEVLDPLAHLHFGAA